MLLPPSLLMIDDKPWGRWCERFFSFWMSDRKHLRTAALCDGTGVRLTENISSTVTMWPLFKKHQCHNRVKETTDKVKDYRIEMQPLRREWTFIEVKYKGGVFQQFFDLEPRPLFLLICLNQREVVSCRIKSMCVYLTVCAQGTLKGASTTTDVITGVNTF